MSGDEENLEDSVNSENTKIIWSKFRLEEQKAYQENDESLKNVWNHILKLPTRIYANSLHTNYIVKKIYVL